MSSRIDIHDALTMAHAALDEGAEQVAADALAHAGFLMMQGLETPTPAQSEAYRWLLSILRDMQAQAPEPCGLCGVRYAAADSTACSTCA